jgi:hypothetical protein
MEKFQYPPFLTVEVPIGGNTDENEKKKYHPDEGERGQIHFLQWRYSQELSAFSSTIPPQGGRCKISVPIPGQGRWPSSQILPVRFS